MKKTISLLTILFLVVSCTNRTKNKFEHSFENTFNIIKKYSIKKDSIEWSSLRKKVFDSIIVFKNNDDYYKGIELTLKLINDGHSIFMRPNKIKKAFSSDINIPKINHKVVENQIGYMKIPGFFANDSLYDIFTLQIRKTLKKIDETNKLSGWIVDLRGNYGGKLTSMILGIAPLLTDSIIVYSINNENKLKTNKHKENYYYLDNKKIDSIDNKMTLKNNGKKIAVLVDSTTASAGELLTIALKNNSNSLVFGTKTRGLTSHLLLFSFASKAKLFLMTEYYSDKNKNIIKRIYPDVNCNSENTLDSAIDWIKNTL